MALGPYARRCRKCQSQTKPYLCRTSAPIWGQRDGKSYCLDMTSPLNGEGELPEKKTRKTQFCKGLNDADFARKTSLTRHSLGFISKTQVVLPSRIIFKSLLEIRRTPLEKRPDFFSAGASLLAPFFDFLKVKYKRGKFILLSLRKLNIKADMLARRRAKQTPNEQLRHSTITRDNKSVGQERTIPPKREHKSRHLIC
jgi:hypothetical protein